MTILTRATLNQWTSRVAEPDMQAAEAVRRALLCKSKPPESLGLLEDMVIRLAAITGEHKPLIAKKDVVIMCGDHGVVAEGVSAFPQEVTGLMMSNFAVGGAAINVLSRQMGADVHVIDIGSKATELPPQVINRKVKAGTDNMAQGPAMSEAEAIQAILTGIEVAEQLVEAGSTLFALGEMGIGNTTPSAALVSVLIQNNQPTGIVGRGTGIDDQVLSHKEQVIARAIEVNQPNPDDALDTLAKVGGLEIAGLVGVIIGAAIHHRPVLLDGVIASAAGLVAVRLAPVLRHYLFATHLSVEPAHAVILREIGLQPCLHMNMRLGEGTGAVLAMPLLEAACRILHEMATFSDLGLPDPV
ncbi:nicotinate-nucleotide--dimethylbenzimidazole phosphoribosyltransferase [Brevibacillus dissolubilis]|uniref:nicotinate-nucleotide--dimethylbenzimidazole phosphoribosyltransferase n=1 Tax=Brevibacillus dissolubilis TaxID=1844116 RepID=UPI0011174D98|nr:nicotinate-nucleotide--dimethylbenzimidazole phosphoribosyltransferase [Brevibacillus dissolubilis]